MPFSAEEWSKTIDELKTGLSRLDPDRMRMHAERVQKGIQALDSIMTDYCHLTCPTCSDACCFGLKVFFNRTDLLYLLTLRDEIPPGQTRAHPFEPCRYLSLSGCELARTVRPYVCVWFLCDEQMALFALETPKIQRQFLKVLQDIRLHRQALEYEYETLNCARR
jgi:hypothetical protein